jgi:protein TonB
VTEPARISPLRSAEFMIAVALLAVCAAVGGAWWLLSVKDKPDAATPGPARNAAAPASAARSDEQAALDSYNRKLQGDFAQLDRQRQAQELRSGEERRRLEAELESARQAQQRAAAEAAPKPTAAAPPAPPPAQAARVAQPAPAAPHQPVRTEAGVDWSSCKRPEYPSISVDHNEQGVVVLRFKVDAQGQVLDGEVADSSGSARLDSAALLALRKCRFRPATVDGAAVAAKASVRFQWKLGG